MPCRFAAVRNKEISQLIKQAVPKIHEEGDEAGLEVLTGKALSFFTRIYRVYKCKLSFSLALLYLVHLFINKLKTKFNSLFLQNDFKYKKDSPLLLKKFPRKS